MQVGIKSRITVCMERYGLSRDQAVEHIKQVAEDETEAAEIGPEKANLVAPPKEEEPEEDDTDGSESSYEDEESDVTGPQSTGEASD